MKFILSIVVLPLLLLALSPARAQLPQPPDLAARQYILMDLESGQVLA